MNIHAAIGDFAVEGSSARSVFIAV
jgi:hypothetical protein